ncbi:MAG: hypothetical protein M3071_21355 [Actinomycetota bacterium]|nr:hypothetical protein [Actinomycetota bacterium]
MSELTVQPLPPDLSAIAPERVISVGSLSKCYWAGLRVGWIRAAPEIVQRLGRLRAALDLGGPLLEQAMALTIFGDFDRLTTPTRSAAQERLAVLVEQLRLHLPDWEFDEPRGWLVGVGSDAVGQRRPFCATRAPPRRCRRDRGRHGTR